MEKTFKYMIKSYDYNGFYFCEREDAIFRVDLDFTRLAEDRAKQDGCCRTEKLIVFYD